MFKDFPDTWNGGDPLTQNWVQLTLAIYYRTHTNWITLTVWNDAVELVWETDFLAAVAAAAVALRASVEGLCLDDKSPLWASSALDLEAETSRREWGGMMELKSTSPPPSLLPEEAIPDAAASPPPGRSGRSLGMILKLGEDCLKQAFFWTFFRLWKIVDLQEIFRFWEILVWVLGKLLSFW